MTWISSGSTPWARGEELAVEAELEDEVGLGAAGELGVGDLVAPVAEVGGALDPEEEVGVAAQAVREEGRLVDHLGAGAHRLLGLAAAASRAAREPLSGAVRGLTPDDVRRQGEEIAAANVELAPFRVLRGIECDILADGRLDLPDDVLAELDWVQASVHGGQRMPRAEMTKRVEEALRHPAVRCLSHPTGRLINRRPENALDLERIFDVARTQGVALEVNGLPARLDLSGEHVRDALRAGVSIVCSTDAHSPAGLDNITLSVATARRGWATAAEVLNTRPSRRSPEPRQVPGRR